MLKLGKTSLVEVEMLKNYEYNKNFESFEKSLKHIRLATLN